MYRTDSAKAFTADWSATRCDQHECQLIAVFQLSVQRALQGELFVVQECRDVGIEVSVFVDEPLLQIGKRHEQTFQRVSDGGGFNLDLQLTVRVFRQFVGDQNRDGHRRLSEQESVVRDQ